MNVEEVVPGQRYHLKVTFTPPKRVTPNQNELGDLTVFTNDPTEPTLALRLVARAR